MKQKRHTTEEIIRILRQAEGGKNVEAVCREHKVTATSYYRWKKRYGGMELQDARRYRELEKENGELKKNTRNRVRGARPESSRMEAAELDAHALRLLLLWRSDRAQGAHGDDASHEGPGGAIAHTAGDSARGGADCGGLTGGEAFPTRLSRRERRRSASRSRR